MRQAKLPGDLTNRAPARARRSHPDTTPGLGSPQALAGAAPRHQRQGGPILTPRPRPVIHTIGHSNHPAPRFIELLQEAGIHLVIDTRSVPYSRHVPTYNRETLSQNLARHDIEYRFMGDTLGGRPTAPALCHPGGRPNYTLMAQQPQFQRATRHLVTQARSTPMVLMCTEHDPLRCHRTLLVAHAMQKQGADVRHIRRDGRQTSHPDLLRSLVSSPVQAVLDHRQGLPQDIDAALERQAARIWRR